MPIGPGKYDAYSMQIMKETKAGTVIVAVVGGLRGNGFSVTSVDPDAHSKLPAMLREMADQIERSTS